MVLTEIKGKRGLRTIGKLMTFADSVSGRPEFAEFVDAAAAVKGDDARAVKALLKLGPILDDDETCDELARIVAYGIGADADDFVENGDLNAELLEMLAKDSEALSFLSGQSGAGLAG